jgi:sucrose-6-phosphate hydrolase SacC (GH32 family)
MASAGVAAVGTLAGTVQNRNDILPWLSSHKGQEYTKLARLNFAVKPSDTNVTLHVFVDHSVVESYAQGGRAVVTQRTYPTDDALGVGVLTLAAGGNGSQDNEADAVVQLLGL